MKYLIFLILPPVLLIIISITIVIATNDYFIYGSVALFIGFYYLLIGTIITHLKRSNSVRIFGIYVLLLVTSFCLQNYNVGGGLESFLLIDFNHLDYTLRTICLPFLIIVGFYYLLNDGELLNIGKSNLFRLTTAILILGLLLELPIFGFHAGWGNGHCHSYWDMNHFH